MAALESESSNMTGRRIRNYTVTTPVPSRSPVGASQDLSPFANHGIAVHDTLTHAIAARRLSHRDQFLCEGRVHRQRGVEVGLTRAGTDGDAEQLDHFCGLRPDQ